MDLIIYHYSKCKKSRAALDYLKCHSIEPVVINYVEEGINPEKLKELCSMLKLKPSDLVRRQEEYYKETLKDQSLSEDDWIKILCEYPKLIKRPIVLKDSDCVIADPPQLINHLL
jgi:arsenate reductase